MFEFLNPWMLAGLAGLVLPVIAHLLSRRKPDVVSWGAMQFLVLSRTAQRRFRLEELLLLLFRMAMITLIALALARPWMSGRLAALFSTRPVSDVILVIDSSYSTDWSGHGQTPHRAARQWCRTLLDSLLPGDHAGVVDCRITPQTDSDTLTQDAGRIRAAIEQLRAPDATSPLAESILKAFHLAARGTSLSRHIVVVTDGQARAWEGIDRYFQQQLDEIRNHASVPAEWWVVNTRVQQPAPVNCSVDRLELSREMTVADFPVRIRTKIRNSGGRATTSVLAHLEIDGQRIAEQTRALRIHPDSEVQIEFEQRFQRPGCHQLTVRIDSDSLPMDDQSDAVIEVVDALPVLLVDGSPHAAPTRSETFFARLALSPPGNPAPWVSVRVSSVAEFTANSLQDIQVVILANVASLDESQKNALTGFVSDGGGLAVMLGDQINTAWYNDSLFANGAGVLPARVGELVTATGVDTAKPGQPASTAVTVAADSLKLPWLLRFQTGTTDGFLSARFSSWYRLIPRNDRSDGADDSARAPGEAGPSPLAAATDPDAQSPADPQTDQQPATTAAMLTTGDPLMIQSRFGRGSVLVFASTLDADWSTLPARPDYVTFLHELVFQLASTRTRRNIAAGMPIILPVPQGQTAEDWLAFSPHGRQLEIRLAGNELKPLLQVETSSGSGLYRLRPKSPGENRDTETGQEADASARNIARNNADELFMATVNRDESNLTPLTAAQWDSLSDQAGFQLIDTPDELFAAVRKESARVEVWFGLMLLFVAFLVGEVVLTRRLVQGGHAYGQDTGE